jgi:hypothetical protein
MNTINIKNFSVSSLLSSKAERITSTLLESNDDPKGAKVETKNIVKKIEDSFKENLLSSYNKEYHPMILDQWSTIFDQALFNSEITRSDLLSCSNARKALEQLNNVIYHIEPNGFHPFENMEFSDSRVTDFLKFVIHPVSFNRKLLTLENLKAIFWRKDPVLLKEIRIELKNILKSIHTNFSLSFFARFIPEFNFSFSKKKSFSNDFLIDSLIEQILCLYSFVEPENGEIIEVPINVKGVLKIGKYEVETITLVPKWLGGPIEAFALNPKKKGFPPIIIFRGTPPNPTADGAFFAGLTDYTPGFSVGETVFKLGEKKLCKWMIKAREKHPGETVKICGHSLGGSLAYQLGGKFPLFSEVKAYDPAGLLPRSLSNTLKGKTFLHPNDLVSTLNYHPNSKNLDIIKVIPKIHRNFYYAHMRPYGFEPSLFLRVNPVAENKRLARKVMLVFHSLYSIPFFIYKALYLLIMITANKIYSIIKPTLTKRFGNVSFE